MSAGLQIPNRNDIDVISQRQMCQCHTDNGAASSFLFKGFNNVKSFNVSLVRVAFFLNLYRIQRAVFMEQHINFPFVFVAVIVDIRLLAVMPIAFDDFRNNVGLKHIAAHCAAFQNFRRFPTGQITGQPCVHKIDFRRFNKAVANIVIIRTQNINKPGSLQNGKPGLYCRL